MSTGSTNDSGENNNINNRPMVITIPSFQMKNLGKAEIPIQTGIGFFDHMLDQLNSHAQVGVGIQVQVNLPTNYDGGNNQDADNDRVHNTNNDDRLDSHNQYSHLDQLQLFATIGSHIGRALKELLPNTHEEEEKDKKALSRFCCPLDEALVECILQRGTGLCEVQLSPYGKYPKSPSSSTMMGGRSFIGRLDTAALESFWTSLAKESGLDIRLIKHRGINGHHIVESSFKAFSRALRNYLDGPFHYHQLWQQPDSDNAKASVALQRHSKMERQTKETSIQVELWLNGESSSTTIDTGIPTLNEFFTTLANEANMTLKVWCKGDLWVDDHHTAEDVSIAVGQCLTDALGTKAGLNRMWVGQATLGNSKVEVTMDLSNRPCLVHDLHETFERAEYVVDQSTMVRLSCEMMEHVLESLVMNGRMTVHIMEQERGATVEEAVMCTAMAFGRALRVCSMVDCRRAGQTASSKGTLSV